MALALDVVIMHHVIDSHSHGGSTGITMPAAQVQGCCGAAAVAMAAIAVRPAPPGSDGGLLQCPCLAVLTGLILLAGLIVTLRLTHAPHTHLPGAALGEDSVRQRAPPIPLRPAQLGVLRL